MININIVTLKNGLQVANFSSPHEFIFDEGTIVPAKSAGEAERLKVTFIESSHEIAGGGEEDNCIFHHVRLRFELSEDIINELKSCEILYLNKELDVLLCPFPMIQAIESHPDSEVRSFRSFCFSIRIEDRINKICSSTKFT